MSNVFITGGAGFIGSHLAKRLAENHKVTVYDHCKKDTLMRLGWDKLPNINLIKGDIMDAAHVKKAMKGADVVMHAAAVIGVLEVNNQLETIRTNVYGTDNVLNAAQENAVSGRVVVFSTSEVFGSMAYHVKETDDVVSGPPGETRWSYNISKIASEHLANGYFLQYGLPTVCVRPFNVYGPGQTMKGAMKQFITKALNNEDIHVYGDGSPIRSWCYVDDFIDCMLCCIENPKAINESFNVGNSKTAITVLGLANRIIELLDSKSKVIHDDPLAMEIQLRIPSTEKAKEILGFEAKTDLDTGILKTAESIRLEIGKETVAA